MGLLGRVNAGASRAGRGVVAVRVT